VTPGEFRLRLCYSKAGRLRWLSHLEVVRALERCIRRAGLPYAITRGFSPHMKIAFGPALPVGTAGEKEYVDVWLTSYTDAEEVLRRLLAVSPVDLAPVQARYIGDREPSLTAALSIAMYRIEIDGKELSADRVRSGVSELLAEGELQVEHRGKHKVFDLVQCIPEDARVDDRSGGTQVWLTVKIGPQGSLRPELFIRAALERAGVEATAVRTARLDTLVVTDEGVWARPM
jgi:radical SAM-linked protein